MQAWTSEQATLTPSMVHDENPHLHTIASIFSKRLPCKRRHIGEPSCQRRIIGDKNIDALEWAEKYTRMAAWYKPGAGRSWLSDPRSGQVKKASRSRWAQRSQRPWSQGGGKSSHVKANVADAKNGLADAVVPVVGLADVLLFLCMLFGREEAPDAPWTWKGY